MTIPIGAYGPVEVGLSGCLPDQLVIRAYTASLFPLPGERVVLGGCRSMKRLSSSVVQLEQDKSGSRATKIRIGFCVLLVGIVLAHTVYYTWAVSYLGNVDLKSRGDLSGAIFFSRPKTLFVGQQMSRNELIAFLTQIDFREDSDPTHEGTFSLSGNEGLRINSRFAEFPSVTIGFHRGRIDGIQNSAGTDVTETTIEPEMLATFVETIRGENNTKKFLARRRALHSEDVIDSDLLYAVMASEDSTFMSHHGLRYLHLLLSLFQGRGGSSISMQVVKNVVSADSSHSVLRKLNELYLTVALEKRLSKEQIIELYMNHVYLGSVDGRFALYGYLSGANAFFNRATIRDLTLSEACTLAGMTNRPAKYLERIKHGDYSTTYSRRDRVLNLLNKNWPDRYPTDVIEAARREPISFAFLTNGGATRQLDEVSKAFIAQAEQQPALVPLNDLPASEYSGVHVFTSIDADLMKAAETALRNHLSRLEQESPPVDNESGAPTQDQLLGSIVAIHPRTGEILTMVGEGAGTNGLNSASLAINALGPPASTIKPFSTIKALTGTVLPNGERYTAATLIDPRLGSVGSWRPEMGVGDVARVRKCLAVSDDGCAAFTTRLIGLDPFADFYQGLTDTRPSPISSVLAIGFGSHTEISALTQARAYSIFSNDGVRVNANAIYKVFQNGQELTIPRIENDEKIANPGAVFITAQLLRSVLGWGYDGNVGTARNLRFARNFLQLHPEIEMGAKTGSGPNNVWMVSVSPNLIVAVLLTYRDYSKFRDAKTVIAAKTAGVIWSEFMEEVLRVRPDLINGHWRQPENVRRLTIDPHRGCLSQQGIDEYFLVNAAPPRCSER
jgi:membrane peptidoglycan carboxypeptidase